MGSGCLWKRWKNWNDYETYQHLSFLRRRNWNEWPTKKFLLPTFPSTTETYPATTASWVAGEFLVLQTFSISWWNRTTASMALSWDGLGGAAPSTSILLPVPHRSARPQKRGHLEASDLPPPLPIRLKACVLTRHGGGWALVPSQIIV